MEKFLTTRREAILKGAVAAAGLSLAFSASTFSRRARAQSSNPNPTADNQLLNGLLSAEHDAIATYTAGASIVANDTTASADVKSTVTAVAVHFQNQHKEHAQALSKLITQNGGTPVADNPTPTLPASFHPATATWQDVIKLAADKEKHAAVTYMQTLEGVTTATAAELIGAIGGTETQHFVVLYLLAEGIIAPNAKTNSMATSVVPTSFVANVGGTTSLEQFPAFTYDPKAGLPKERFQ